MDKDNRPAFAWHVTANPPSTAFGVGRYGMLRCRRWAVVRIFGTHSSVLSGSKNVREISSRYTCLVRYRAHSTGVGIDRVPNIAVMTNEAPTIAAESKPTIQLDALSEFQNIRDVLAGNISFNPSAVRYLYRTARPRLSYLTKSEFSTLLALFGALSHYTSPSTLPPTSFSLSSSQLSILANASRSDFRSWWGFVLEVGSDQAALGRKTTDADSYWLMLAHLAHCLSYFRSLGSNSHRNCNTSNLHRSISQNIPIDSTGPSEAPTTYLEHAHVLYSKLSKNHFDKAVHHDYLHQLLCIHQHTLSLSNAGSFDMNPHTSPIMNVIYANITSVLQSLLSRSQFRFDSCLASLFWRIIDTVHFERSQRKGLLRTLRSRLSLLHASRTAAPSPSTDPLWVLRQTLLDRPVDIESWVYQEAHSLLHDAQAWELLHLLARGSRDQPYSLTGVNPTRRIAVLSALHQLDQQAQRDSELHSAELERWWDRWTNALGTEVRSLPPSSGSSMDRAIVLRFLQLGAQYRSSRVVSGAERLLAVYPNMIVAQDRVQASMSYRDSLSVSLGAACACLGVTDLTILCARLRTVGFVLDKPRLPSSYTSRLIELLLELRNPRAAWDIACQVYADLPAALVGALAHACAKSGLIVEAITFLSDARLAPNKRHCIALSCLVQLAQRQGVLTRAAALNVCGALGSNLDLVPTSLRPAAVRMALNAGLVQIAGIMGTQWRLSPKLQRLLATRLVKSWILPLAIRVVDKTQAPWLDEVLKRAGNCQISLLGAQRGNSWVACGKNNSARRSNLHIIHSHSRLGGRAQLRATLATLARLLRNGLPHGASFSWDHGASRQVEGAESKRARFEPDGVTLNIVVRALARCHSCVSSSELRALFDVLARHGRCGRSALGNQFGTEADYVAKGFVSSATALVGLLPSDARPSFVRHIRPLLKTFLTGFRTRGDREAVRVVRSVLKSEDTYWRQVWTGVSSTSS